MGTRAAALAALLLATPAVAAEDVTISTAATSNGTLSGGVFTPTGANAVLNVNDLLTALATSGVAVSTGSTGSQHGDITIAAPFVWTANLLSLSANRSIVIAANIKAQATAALTLTTNPATGTLSFDAARATFANTAEVLTINSVVYTLASDLTTLAADISGNPSGHFALTRNFDASASTYAHPPIPTTFTGTLEGMGNNIIHLTILDTTAGDRTALFSWLGAGGAIRDMGVSDVFIQNTAQANVAGLVALNDGSLTAVLCNGQVMGAGNDNVGGLVAASSMGSAIVNSHSTASVSAGNGASVGGLVGNNSGNVTNSYATGSVSDSMSARIGGLIGWNPQENTLVTLSYATGNVHCGSCDAGGLVGRNDPSAAISQSYATGNVICTGACEAGGLVGFNEGAVANAYSRGDVSAAASISSIVGGFLGADFATPSVTNSYSTGAPSSGGGALIGGFIGYDSTTGIANAYWDTTTSGITSGSQGAGSPSNDPGITGLTSSQLTSGLPTGFAPSLWAITSGINDGLPYLKALPPS